MVGGDGVGLLKTFKTKACVVFSEKNVAERSEDIGKVAYI